MKQQTISMFLVLIFMLSWCAAVILEKDILNNILFGIAIISACNLVRMKSESEQKKDITIIDEKEITK